MDITIKIPNNKLDKVAGDLAELFLKDPVETDADFIKRVLVDFLRSRRKQGKKLNLSKYVGDIDGDIA